MSSDTNKDVANKVVNDMILFGIGIYKSEKDGIRYIDPLSPEGREAFEKAKLEQDLKDISNPTQEEL